jgi:hypothetical protein
VDQDIVTAIMTASEPADLAAIYAPDSRRAFSLTADELRGVPATVGQSDAEA